MRNRDEEWVDGSGRFRSNDVSFRTLVERLSVIVYVGSSGWNNAAIYASPRIEAVLGYSREQWLIDPGLWEKILHPQDREHALAEATRARENGELFGTEYRLVAKDGRVVWVRDEAVPTFDGEGGISDWRGVMLDITERKKYEEGLRRSEERHRLVAKATGEAIWDNDLTTGEQEWGGATEALFGYPPHRGGTSNWWEERIHPEDRRRVLSGLRSLYESDGESWTEEYRFRRADGSYAIVVDRGHVVRDENGEAVRMVGSMADVTERRLWEEKLRGSEERFRTTFETAAVGMAYAAPDGRFLRVNGRFCEIVGHEHEKLTELTFWDITPPEEMDAARIRLRRVLESGTSSYAVERRYVRGDGSRVWTSLEVSLARKPSGEPNYFHCIAENITEQKITELVPNPLTPRELEILREVAAGKKNREIVAILRYSLGTVKLDVQNIILKLGGDNRRQAADRAIEIGLIPPPRR